MRPVLFASLIGLSACSSEIEPYKFEIAPNVTILEPEADAAFPVATAVFLSGKITDDGGLDVLEIQWESDLDGLLAEVEADVDGYVEHTTANLSGGTHVIRLVATDLVPLIGDDTVTITVDGDLGVPVLTVIHPETGETGREDTPFGFEVEVVDDTDLPEDLLVSLSSDVDGPICELDPAGGDSFDCEEILTPGLHLLEFDVLDSDDKQASKEVQLLVLKHTEIDDDGDGFTEDQGDCDDDDDDVFPGAPEILNGVDDDCDGIVDEGTEAYDDDGDGFTELDGDCDDANDQVYPGAPEVADGIDNDCDGVVDEGTNAYDDDLDGWTEDQGDCDDADPSVNPDKPEICDDGLDNDCSGIENDEDAIGCDVWYQDVDGDGYGLDDACLCASDPVTNFDAEDGDDCDDGDPDVNPGETEIPYDGIDNDCSGSDEVDVDGDGYSAVAAGGDDCDDNDIDINPSQVELPDGKDQDCDGMLDEGTSLYDDDGDGFCDDETDPCTLQPNQTTPWENKDCDDGDADVNPDADEVCGNSIDDDCDEDIDEDNAIGCDTYYADADFDGFGHETDSRCLCGTDAVYDVEAPLNTDCDDGSNTINPGASESPNRLDDNCDDNADEGTDWFDDDGDGYCETDTTICTQQTWQTSPWPGGDCDDTSTGVDVNPGEDEICSNGFDDNCSGEQDEENADGCDIYNRDGDGDGYGLYNDTQCLCSASTIYDVPGPVSTSYDDCDDDATNVNPGASESADRVDNDCDGEADEGTTWYDDDGDGYCEIAPCTLQSYQWVQWPGGDCDDTGSSAYWVNPGRPEICNDGLDNNCEDGQDEEGASGSKKYYKDADNDGYGHETTYKNLCSASAPYDQADNDDCNDSNSSVKPTAGWKTSSDSVAGWDWNCDNTVDKWYSQNSKYDCWITFNFLDGFVCNYQSGFSSSGQLDCGEAKTYYSGCQGEFSLDFCEASTTQTLTQYCK
jgi:large repetitive protein